MYTCPIISKPYASGFYHEPNSSQFGSQNEGSTFTYTCFPGYGNPSGTYETLTCQNGQWIPSPDVVQCESKLNFFCEKKFPFFF